MTYLLTIPCKSQIESRDLQQIKSQIGGRIFNRSSPKLKAGFSTDLVPNWEQDLQQIKSQIESQDLQQIKSQIESWDLPSKHARIFKVMIKKNIQILGNILNGDIKFNKEMVIKLEFSCYLPSLCLILSLYPISNRTFNSMYVYSIQTNMYINICCFVLTVSMLNVFIHRIR